jgi:H+/Cl- antiporter ClcA
MLFTAPIAGGSASVFGTPLAGMVFGLGVRRVGTMRHDARFACLVAATCANAATAGGPLATHCTPLDVVTKITALSVVRAAVSGVAFRIIALVSVRVSHGTAL